MTAPTPYLITPKLRRATDADVRALADWLGHSPPAGYPEYVTRWGAGTYDNRLIVRLPAEIMAETRAEQAFVQEYFDEFWGEDPTLTRDEAARCAAFAYSIDGDKIFYSYERRALFVLPRHDECVYWLPQGFADLLEWGRGPPSRPALVTFDSGIDRATVELFTAHALSVDAVADAITRFAPAVHRVHGPWGTLLYLPDLHGRAQLTQAQGDTRVGVRLDCDTERMPRLSPIIAMLETLGMFVAQRSQ
ncbi:hypothetical protein [Xanthomonas vesicatoria]|uniref:SMI1/KNR4 family protein n=2 Tax=Xanthomonas vesicatoria TaxID=56460 RepID=A0AAJ0IVS0_9XANT|nr:hypothetical protein [Xanthomonas vesicatoria]APO96315.1 hypothetical protein BI313_18500 [Xanthomonas vesicatoria]APP76404.1 hypothetical protein BJD12_15485 [Xanthomonas vesicatoria ATCC 35937]EGD07192.1 hypothetical protein XVE_4609 [Xanthomonas vesicatoria ATCC 35937]KHM91483.1 hypothetical protein OR61_18990 [Xanthomonas vesicatoria]KHM91618.1 hypothetical protein OR60_19055 [Xanthomonas vesicatoria]